MIIVYSYNFTLIKLYKITNIMKRGLFMDKSFDVLILTQTIEKLCKENHITVKEMLSKSNLNRNVVDNLKKGSIPSVDKIVKIADYFNISTDYLLGRTDISMIDLSQRFSKNHNCVQTAINNGNIHLSVDECSYDEMETELLKVFRELSFRDKIKFINEMMEKSKNNH